MCGAGDESLSRLLTTAVRDIPIRIGKIYTPNCDYGRKSKMKLSMGLCSMCPLILDL